MILVGKILSTNIEGLLPTTTVVNSKAEQQLLCGQFLMIYY